jgi:hypothetical protein
MVRARYGYESTKKRLKAQQRFRESRERKMSNEVRRFIEQPVEPVERILVDDRGDWIEKHGEPAGDRRRQPSFVLGLQVRKSEPRSVTCMRTPLRE